MQVNRYYVIGNQIEKAIIELKKRAAKEKEGGFIIKIKNHSQCRVVDFVISIMNDGVEINKIKKQKSYASILGITHEKPDNYAEFIINSLIWCGLFA